MLSLKEGYYYFFYKMYKAIDYTSKAMGGRFWTDFKAGVVMIVLEIWFLFSIGAYYAAITKTSIELKLNMPIIYVPLLVIIGFNYLMFVHTPKWKEYNREFDQWPKRKNRIGTWIVLGIILFIVANVIFSFYLMSRIDWQSIRAQ